MSRLVVVSATRLSQEAFWKGSALGQSLLRLGADTSPLIAFDNSQGLPSIYNYAIDAAPEGSTLVFVHDDVWLDDFHFAVRIAEGLDRFDAIAKVTMEDFKKDRLVGSCAHGSAVMEAFVTDINDQLGVFIQEKDVKKTADALETAAKDAGLR